MWYLLKLLISAASVKAATHNTHINEPGYMPIKLTYKHRQQARYRYPWYWEGRNGWGRYFQGHHTILLQKVPLTLQSAGIKYPLELSSAKTFTLLKSSEFFFRILLKILTKIRKYQSLYPLEAGKPAHESNSAHCLYL